MHESEKADAAPSNLQWRDGTVEAVEVERFSSTGYDPQSTSAALRNKTVENVEIKINRAETTHLEDVSIIYTLNDDLEKDGNLLVKEYLEKIEEVTVESNVVIDVS